MQPLTLIRAPSNLGLRPLASGHVPGAWKAPAALTEAGLVESLRPNSIVDLSPPSYSSDAQPGSRLLNGPAIRAHALQLADAVETSLHAGSFPIVVGGDCSVLLGALVGVRRGGHISLVHMDGHSDFRHPGNYESDKVLGAVAGMDLALATGRGEPLLTEWPGIEGPLVTDRRVVQIGERECRDTDWAWPDIRATAIRQINVFDARDRGAAWVLRETEVALVQDPVLPFWLHFDVDVLGDDAMPAVDCPGHPGLEPRDVSTLLGALLGNHLCAGLTVTVYDPDRDHESKCAKLIIELLATAAFRHGDGGKVYAGDRADVVLDADPTRFIGAIDAARVQPLAASFARSGHPVRFQRRRR